MQPEELLIIVLVVLLAYACLSIIRRQRKKEYRRQLEMMEVRNIILAAISAADNNITREQAMDIMTARLSVAEENRTKKEELDALHGVMISAASVAHLMHCAVRMPEIVQQIREGSMSLTKLFDEDIRAERKITLEKIESAAAFLQEEYCREDKK